MAGREPRRFLITGGAGFIGSHLAEALLDAGHEVSVLDDLSTGSIANVAHLKSQPAFRYSIDTLENEPLLAELIDGADAVFHLAAAVGVRLVVESPVRTIETNIEGTRLVLKHAVKKKKPVLVASTSEVYGKSARVPFSEEDDSILGPTTKARWSYACSKMIDEFLAFAYWRERGLPTVVARLFNTVGPRQVGHYGMVIPRFVRQALDGGPITVYGDGRQTRCFCDVADVVGALIRLISEPGATGEVVNVGSDQEISILELARKVRDRAGTGAAIEHVPYDRAYAAGFEDMQRRVPDTSKIRRLLGWAPTRGIDEILERVFAHHGSRQAALPAAERSA